MVRVDFSANARAYDDRHGAFVDDDLARRLIDAAALPSGARVLDVGAGTGRVAIPLASRGCRVVALDPSTPMLARTLDKAPGVRLALTVGAGAPLPFRDRSFDGVVIARLLYLLSDWRETLDEAVRVLRGGGCLLHEWGNGDPDEEWVQMREKARALFENAGVASPFHPGARDESQIDLWLRDRGMSRAGEVRAPSAMRTTMGKFLERVERSECTYTWSVPEDVQRACLPALRAWAAERFDLEREVPAPRETKWTVFRKRAP